MGGDNWENTTKTPLRNTKNSNTKNKPRNTKNSSQ